MDPEGRTVHRPVQHEGGGLPVPQGVLASRCWPRRQRPRRRTMFVEAPVSPRNTSLSGVQIGLARLPGLTRRRYIRPILLGRAQSFLYS